MQFAWVLYLVWYVSTPHMLAAPTPHMKLETYEECKNVAKSLNDVMADAPATYVCVPDPWKAKEQ